MPLRLQTLDSSGPTGKLRGNAYQLHEKYLAMARDAHSSGDRVAAENYFQHAEHYHRIINSNGGGHVSRHDFDAFPGTDEEQPEIRQSSDPSPAPLQQQGTAVPASSPANGKDGTEPQPY